MPTYDCVVNEHNYPLEWTWFHKGMEFEEFDYEFCRWFQKQAGVPVAVGIAIRSDESLNRFNTIINQTKQTFRGYAWTTKVHTPEPDCDVYNFYPLYDWRTEDIWGAVSKLDLEFNEIYELMYKNGLKISQQRLCQPYGDDQRNGLDQFRALGNLGKGCQPGSRRQFRKHLCQDLPAREHEIRKARGDDLAAICGILAGKPGALCP